MQHPGQGGGRYPGDAAQLLERRTGFAERRQHGLLGIARGHTRGVVLGELALAVLRDQRRVVAERRLRAGEAWRDNGLVFPDRTGGYLHDKAFNAVRHVCVQAGIEPVRPHALRHWNASLALANGAPLALVARQLGHCNPHVTSMVYSHAVSDTRLVSETLEVLLAQRGKR